MPRSEPLTKEGNDNELIEEISKLQQISLGNGDGAGLLSDENVGEGDDIVVYLFRAALDHTYSVGRIVTPENAPPIQEFTLGTRELIVRGRVGYATDHRTQSSWPILLAPHILTVSDESTTDGTDVEDQAIKATVPTTEEPDIWPAFLPDGEIEVVTDEEILEEELGE